MEQISVAEDVVNMSITRKQIKFQKSMSSDKRDGRFAYWRENVLNWKTEGLYPSYDYVTLDTKDKTLGFWNDAAETLDGSFRTAIWSNSSFNTVSYFNYDNIGAGAIAGAGGRVKGAVAGQDGIYVLEDNLSGTVKVRKVTSSSVTDIATFPDAVTDNTVGLWDGVYYWWVNKDGAWRQSPGGTPTKILSDVGYNVVGACLYQDYIAILCNTTSNAVNLTLLLWDKADSDLFARRVDVQNAIALAIATLKGKLTVVYSVGNTRNPKEYFGEIIVGQYDGYKLETVNTLVSNSERNYIYQHGTSNTGFASGSEVIILPLGTATTKSSDLTKDYFVKIESDGKISIEKSFSPITNHPFWAKVFFNRNVLVYETATTSYLQDNKQYSNFLYTDYTHFSSTEYITNFLENPFGRYKLKEFSFSFEKLFKNTAGSGGDEEVSIYYRTSDREDFTLMATVDAQKVWENTNKEAEMTGSAPILQQRYQISQMPDGTALPEFNEIQFKFELKNGMSIIGAFYGFETISHVTFSE